MEDGIDGDLRLHVGDVLRGQARIQAGARTATAAGTGSCDGAGLWWVPIDHDGNQNYSLEEVDAVARLVERFLAPGATWTDENGLVRQLTGGDLRIVSPFNAQVNRIAERVAAFDVPVGTVDKFQGQEAPIVIYSMATSRPEDAPRGMESLYSLNRFNVATSRARCAVLSSRLRVCSSRYAGRRSTGSWRTRCVVMWSLRGECVKGAKSARVPRCQSADVPECSGAKVR
jgi:hypothetical protein